MSMPLEGSVAQTLLDACSEAVDAVDAQRRLAGLLLANKSMAQPQSDRLLEQP